MKKQLLPLCCAALAVTFLLSVQSGRAQAPQKAPAVIKLSQYSPGLKGTPGDTDVYVLDSGKNGGNALVLGGTHGNEPSGYVTATLLAENARPTAGKLLVIPCANASAVRHPDARKGIPRKFSLKTPCGDRVFPFGSRLTNPADQAPDPERYTHPRAKKSAEGSTARNLNRVYPGKVDGTLTEKVAFGIMELIRKEKVDLAVDLHEANPDSPLKNLVVAHQKALDLGAEAVIRLQLDGISMRLDSSPPQMYGISHREWGDNSNALAILMETVNPAQGPKSGDATEETIVLGRDGNPLAERVARHAAALQVLFQVYTEQNPKRPIIMGGIPDYAAIKADLGKYLCAERKKP